MASTGFREDPHDKAWGSWADHGAGYGLHPSMHGCGKVFNNGVVWYCCNRPGWKLAGESAGEGPRPRKHVN